MSLLFCSGPVQTAIETKKHGIWEFALHYERKNEECEDNRANQERKEMLVLRIVEKPRCCARRELVADRKGES